jgi:energy-coupling factor transport system ATP-binding protein
MIEIQNLRLRTLYIEHLDIPRGVSTVIGRNGSGKTTFLRLCAGIAVPECGTILINKKNPRLIDIGWVNEYPDRNMLFLKVSDEIASSLRFQYMEPDEADLAVYNIANRLGIQHLLSKGVNTLSGGEKVLVALAAALVVTPPLVVLDEYDSHLDEERCLQIGRALRGSGCDYIIQCTQQMETAARSDFLIMLDKGKLAYAGTPADVFSCLADTGYYPLSWRI